jgi:hypothetical protein
MRHTIVAETSECKCDTNNGFTSTTNGCKKCIEMDMRTDIIDGKPVCVPLDSDCPSG